MLIKLEKHFLEKFFFVKQKKLALAVSGGIDSMVMVNLFVKLGLDITILHCNFSLRDEESENDAAFVKQTALQYNVPFFSKKFDTQKIATLQKQSIQLAARQLRYDWFNEVLKTEKLDYLATAHHADDNLETFLINLSRGTGIEGLTGIPEITKNIIRPLLIFSRQDIENYAFENKISWREDSSNASDKYLRNKLRHQVIPSLKEINNDLLYSFQKTLQYLQQTETLANDAAEMVYEKIVIKTKNGFKIPISQLLLLSNYKSYLYLWLKNYGFTAWDDIASIVHKQSGKQIFSNEYKLLKNRDFLIVSKKDGIETRNEQFVIEKNQKQVKIPLNISISVAKHFSNTESNIIFVDESKLLFPLIIRRWQEADYFYPFGMKGKKKLSKYFKDEKMSLYDKQNIWLLCSNNDIVWIINKRLDDRFKVANSTQNILKITLHYDTE